MDMKELQRLKNITYEQLDIVSIPDVSNAIIDASVPIDERMQKFCDSIKNPYFLKSGKTVVEVKFSEGKGTIENKVIDYLKSAKSQ